MPEIHISCPRLSRAAKRRAVAAVTKAFADATGFEPGIITIHITEHPYDNVGVGGKLLSDAYPELASRPFYYSVKDPPWVKKKGRRPAKRGKS